VSGPGSTPEPDSAKPHRAGPESARPESAKQESSKQESQGGPDNGPDGFEESTPEKSGPGTGGLKLAGNSEHRVLGALSKVLPRPPEGEVWAGDDTAVVAVPGLGKGFSGGLRLLLTADAVVSGIDADLSLTSLPDFGWKAMAVNLSDIAAMGGTPGHALVSVVGASPEQLGSIYEGILEAAAAYNCPVVGGDLSAGTELVVSVALTGWVNAPPVLRSGAKPGDTIWVTGPLGGAAAGLRLLRQHAMSGTTGLQEMTAAESELVRAHVRPRPALSEGAMAREIGATAMIDVSDGLAADLSLIADLSGVGFELVNIPIAPGATLAEALGGGDDYVLVFTMPGATGPRSTGPRPTGPRPTGSRPPGSRSPGSRSPGSRSTGPSPTGSGPAETDLVDDIADAFSEAGLSLPIPIGTCVPDGDRRLLAGRRLEVTGWDHSL
jgi:thiamine-monophosphate kinase